MFKNYKILSLVIARGGSKGLKNKNTRKFADKSLIAWTILASKKSRYVDHTLVSTDSNKIINIAKNLGVNAPFKRPSKYAKDSSSVKDVIFHALSWLKKNKKLDYDFLLLLQPTSPLRTSKDIDNSLKYYFGFSKSKKETMISVTKAPIKTGLLLEKKGQYVCPAIGFTKTKSRRRQDQKNYFLANGAIYFCNINKFSGSFLTRSTLCFEMSQEASIDIDNIDDFNKALDNFRSKNKLL